MLVDGVNTLAYFHKDCNKKCDKIEIKNNNHDNDNDNDSDNDNDNK